MNQMDRMRSALERTQDFFDFDNVLKVYEASSTYTPGDSVEPSYTEALYSPISGEVQRPTGDTETELTGTQRSVDVVIRVTEDRIDWSESGESGSAQTVVEDTMTGIRYEVDLVHEERNGLLVLVGDEL